MRLAALVVVLGVARASAAPWSIELPPGYVEQPGAGADQIARLRALKSTISIDVQVYLSPDGDVQLTRMTWLTKFDDGPTRGKLEQMDRGVVSGAAKSASKHISDSRHWVGDQLVGESIDEANDIVVHQRRLYSVDANGTVHLLSVLCGGPADKLAACLASQQRMQLVLPNAAKLEEAREKTAYELGYMAGQVVGVLGIILLVIWLVVRRRKQS